MDREKYLKGLDFCMTHTICAGCPIKDECKGAYEMLERTFEYIKELRGDKDNGSEKKEN